MWEFAALLATIVWATPTDLRPLPRQAGNPVLLEPRVQDHYGFLRDYDEVPLHKFNHDKSPQILRVTNLDDASFQQYVRDGIPFVVDDCMTNHDDDAICTFECKDFAKRWPSGNMRAEYTPGQYHIYLKDPHWYSKIEPQRAHKEHMAGDKKIAGPYIWHVKDEEPLKTKRSVQQHWRTPYFLRPSIANRMEANESFEFWFSMAGGGTFTHADSYCESTISMQFSGKKRWRIQAFPEVVHFFNATAYGDSEIYDHKTHVPWTPETEFTVGPGQCFIFPTGYLHETFVDPTQNDEKCYTASTFQFNHPRQVNLYRSYLSRFSMSHYGMTEPCLNTMQSYATLLSRKNFNEEPNKDSIHKEAKRLIKLYDQDADNRISASEIFKHISSKRKREVLEQGGFSFYPWRGLLSAADKKIFGKEALSVWAEDACQYHDIDRDGFVTVEELTDGLLQWNVVNHRLANMRASREIRNPREWFDQTVQQEIKMLREHYCKQPDVCPVADELEAYRDRVRRGKNKYGKKQMARVLGMLENEDQSDEKLTMVDRTSGSSSVKAVSELKQEL